jgi:hypothetical protein
LAREGFSTSAYVSITSTRKGKVESEVNSKSIDGLLAAVRKRAITGNPDYINNLRLYISEKNRTVDIHIILAGGGILDEGVSVSVTGDEEWVQGRSSVLREFLEDTRSSLLTGRGHSRLPLFFTGFVLALAVTIPVASALGQGDSIGVALLLALSLSAVLGGGGFFVGSLLDRRKQTQLVILPGAQRSKIDLMGLTSLIATILGIIVAIVAILVAHADAINPH